MVFGQKIKMKKVIVIGGGFAGSLAAQELEKDFDVTLIDTKNYFEFTPGILRTIIEPEHIKRIHVSHTHYLKKTKVVLGKAGKISEKKVRVNDRNYSYDYLVICSGSSYNFPIKGGGVVMADRMRDLTECHSKLESSSKILIVGGGLVGVELAGEICNKYKNKKIIMVEFEKRLMIRNNLKSAEYALSFLVGKGAKVIFNEKVVSSKGDLYLTDKKRKIKADMMFLCTGIKPNSEFMRRKYLDKKDFIKVNNYLQVVGHKNIFAVGDVNNVLQENTAQNAERQAKFAVRNILALDNKEKLVKYESKKTALVISLGKHDGIFEYKDFVFGGFIPSIMKVLIEKWVMWTKS